MDQHSSKGKNQGQTLSERFDSLASQNGLKDFGKQDFLQLIAHHRDEENWEEALHVSEAALRIHLLDAEFLGEKADLLLEQHRAEEAMEILPLLEQIGADEIRVSCLRAKALFQNGDIELARILLGEVRQFAPKSKLPEILLLEASLLNKLDLKVEAYMALKEVLLVDPRNRTALERIWLASESSRNQKDSLSLHQSILDKDPYNALAWFNSGQALYYLLRFEEALEAFEYAAMIESDFKLSYAFAAEVSLAIGQPKRALKSLYDIMQRTTPDAGLLKLAGQAYMALENTAKARQYYLHARNLDPLDDELYAQLGKIYMLEGKPGIAARYFERAVNLDDRNEEYLIELARAWKTEGRAAEAEACFVRATEVAPEVPEPWIHYAEYQWDLEAFQSILDLTEEAMEHTWGAGICFIRAAALFRLGLRKEALRTMEEALEEHYEEHAVFFRYLPEYRNDKDIRAILRYFAA